MLTLTDRWSSGFPYGSRTRKASSLTVVLYLTSWSEMDSVTVNSCECMTQNHIRVSILCLIIHNYECDCHKQNCTNPDSKRSFDRNGRVLVILTQDDFSFPENASYCSHRIKTYWLFSHICVYIFWEGFFPPTFVTFVVFLVKNDRPTKKRL